MPVIGRATSKTLEWCQSKTCHMTSVPVHVGELHMRSVWLYRFCVDERKRSENGSVDVKRLLRFQWNENGPKWKSGGSCGVAGRTVWIYIVCTVDKEYTWKWSSQLWNNLKLQRKFFFEAPTGFEAMSSVIPVQCSTDWAMIELRLKQNLLSTRLHSSVGRASNVYRVKKDIEKKEKETKVDDFHRQLSWQRQSTALRFFNFFKFGNIIFSIRPSSRHIRVKVIADLNIL